MRPRPDSALLAFALAAAASACSTDSPVAPAHRTGQPGSGRSAAVADGTFTSFDVPGSVGTLALDINARGTIVGRYLAPTTPLTTHGFIRTPDGQITTIDYPGSSFTATVGINARGDIVGQYAVPSAPRQRHGFLLSAGVFTSFDPEGSTFTNVLGINDRGDIVGRYCTLAVCGQVGTGIFHGFLLSDGQFAPVTFPGSTETDAWKINSQGQIAGGFVATGGAEHAFVMKGGTYTELALPITNPVSMDNGGQNARGDIVGLYCDGAPPCVIVPTGTHGFFLGNDEKENEKNGEGSRHVRHQLGFETIDYPGATATSAIGINARRDIVGGWFDTNGSIHGFLLTRTARD